MNREIPDGTDAETVSVGIRMPAALKTRLMSAADANDRSFNRETVLRLSASLDLSGRGTQREVFEALGLPRAVRLATSGPAEDAKRLLLVSEYFGADGLLIGAKAHELHGATLVAVVETPDRLYVMDTSWINLSRAPRVAEVVALIRKWDALGLLASARYCSQLLPDTSGLPAEAAAQAIARAGHTRPIDLGDFGRLLAQEHSLDMTALLA